MDIKMGRYGKRGRGRCYGCSSMCLRDSHLLACSPAGSDPCTCCIACLLTCRYLSFILVYTHRSEFAPQSHAYRMICKCGHACMCMWVFLCARRRFPSKLCRARALRLAVPSLQRGPPRPGRRPRCPAPPALRGSRGAWPGLGGARRAQSRGPPMRASEKHQDMMTEVLQHRRICAQCIAACRVCAKRGSRKGLGAPSPGAAAPRRWRAPGEAGPARPQRETCGCQLT